jgi:multidrug efflux pump
LPEMSWDIMIDRAQALPLGADLSTVGAVIQMLSAGYKIGTYRPINVDNEVDIVIRFSEDFRTLDHINSLLMPTTIGQVPLGNMLAVAPQKKIGKISRVDGNRVMTINADVMPGVLVSEKINNIQSWIAKNITDPDIKISFNGEEKDRKESGLFLMKAFLVAIFLVFLILVTQFNSYFYAGVILSAVIMSTVGVNVGLLIHQLPFGVVMGGIGIIALAGIIVSNNIILIDTFVLLKQEAFSKIVSPTKDDIKNIIMETCRQRVRPVILTKMTTILGLLPIMFGIDINFFDFTITQGAPSTQWWVLLSTCIVYGVLFASTLTLFVTPAMLMWWESRKGNLNL